MRFLALTIALGFSVSSAEANEFVDMVEIHGCWAVGPPGRIQNNLCLGKAGVLNFERYALTEGFGTSGTFKLSKTKIKIHIEPIEGGLPDGSDPRKSTSFTCDVDFDRRITFENDEHREMRIKNCPLAGTWIFQCYALTEDLQCMPKQKGG